MTQKKKQTPDYPWLKDYPKGVTWDTEIPVLPLYRLLEDSVDTYPDHTALNFFGKRITYKELGVMVDQAAKGLGEIGVAKGKKVGLLLPNCPHFVIMYYAILKVGGTVVNFNPLSAMREIREQVIDSGTSIVVTLDLKELFSKAQELLNSTTLEHIIVGKLQDYLPFPKNLLFPLLKHKDIFPVFIGRRIISMQALLENDGIIVPPDINPTEDIALLQYTGGTTGTPKGAVLTHANLYTNTLQSCMWFSKMNDGEEILLAVLPFFHCFAMTALMNLGIQKGAEIVIHPRFNLDDLLKAIPKKKVTVLAGVPPIFNAINNHHHLDKYDFSSLKICISGGAPLPREVRQTFEERMQCPLAEGYGLTEASPVVSVNPFLMEGITEIDKPLPQEEEKKSSEDKTQEAHTHRERERPPRNPNLGSAGLPLPNTIITIRDKDNTKKELSLGEIGEICIQGPQVMKEYYNKPEETALVLVDGVLRTGDLGYLDDKGFLYIVDRLKEMIISNGYNIYPRNVEEALYQYPAVEEAAVLGKPEPQRGEIVVAYIKLKDNTEASKDVIRNFLKQHLSVYEIPREIHFVDAMPKTLIGKISKKDLKKKME